MMSSRLASSEETVTQGLESAEFDDVFLLDDFSFFGEEEDEVAAARRAQTRAPQVLQWVYVATSVS